MAHDEDSLVEPQMVQARDGHAGLKVSVKMHRLTVPGCLVLCIALRPKPRNARPGKLTPRRPTALSF